MAFFYARARGTARRSGDRWTLGAAAPPEDLAVLLRLARGRRRIAELGTGTAWTSIALALPDPRRRVVTFDTYVRPQRDRYLALVPPDVRERIDLITDAGDEGAPGRGPVDLLFIDSSHEHQGTIDDFRAWRRELAPGAVVAFDDFGHPDFPGVAEAVADLGLEGEDRGGLFVWQAPGA